MVALALYVLVTLSLGFLVSAIGFQLAARWVSPEALTFRDAGALTLWLILLEGAALVAEAIIIATLGEPAATLLMLAMAIGVSIAVVSIIRARLHVGIARAIGAWAVVACARLLVAMCVRSSVIQAFWVPSGAMLPTIQIGDHMFVDKLAYSLRLPLIGTELGTSRVPQRGDVVVFASPVDPSTDLVKRVIAVPGDTVEIRDKQVYVNGDKVPDPHAYFADPAIMTAGRRDNMAPTQVPDGQFFTLGDNRDRSYDSRFWGFANLSDIKGKVTVIYWSVDNGSPRWSRIGHDID